MIEGLGSIQYTAVHQYTHVCVSSRGEDPQISKADAGMSKKKKNERKKDMKGRS